MGRQSMWADLPFSPTAPHRPRCSSRRWTTVQTTVQRQPQRCVHFPVGSLPLQWPCGAWSSPAYDASVSGASASARCHSLVGGLPRPARAKKSQPLGSKLLRCHQNESIDISSSLLFICPFLFSPSCLSSLWVTHALFFVFVFPSSARSVGNVQRSTIAWLTVTARCHCNRALR